MLESCLDDSGTHEKSRVLVWGAIAGDKSGFERLDADWKAQLANPCKGKPPIKSFHSSHLYMGTGEFEGYSQAEKDRTRYNFREIIFGSKLTLFSYGISIEAWEKVCADHPYLGKCFNPESFILSGIYKRICEEAKPFGLPISFQIDQERFNPEIVTNLKIAREKAGIDEQLVSYNFLPVAGVTGLQAADVFAHGTYQFYRDCLDDPNAEPDIHLQRLAEGIYAFRDGWFGEEELRRMAKKVEGNIDWSLKDASSEEA